MESLRYRDDDDKCMGATGMAIALVVLNGENLLASLDVDAEPDGMVEFMPEFYFEGNPRLMASASWRRLIGNFNLTAGLLIGNVLCRRMVGTRCMPADDERQYIRDIVVEEGTSTCSLEPEEAANLFENNYDRFTGIFMRRGVHSLAHEFASLLKAERRLSRMDVLQNLRSLSMI